MATFGGVVIFGDFLFYFKGAFLVSFFTFCKMVLKLKRQLFLGGVSFLTFIDLRFILDFFILKGSF